MSGVPRWLRHVRKLWPGGGIYWPVPFVLWLVYCTACGERRWEVWALAIGVLVLAYTNPATKRLFIGLLPMALLALLYDGMRFVKNLGITAARVHVCDLRRLDMHLASVRVAGRTLGLHDWIQAHPNKLLDLLCAIPYGTFLYVTIAFAISLYFTDYEGLRRFGWVFLCVNLMGFITYHLYPAAPPWYYHAYGCHVDLATRASEGPNLARVDQWLGTRYFAAFYARSNDVFGAVPSLHVAYPWLTISYGYRRGSWYFRSFAVLFFLAMCFAAVYLDHHWLIDVLLGIVYAFAAELGVRRWFGFRRSKLAHAEPHATPRLGVG